MSTLQEKIAELCEAGPGRMVGEQVFLPLLTLESGRDYGLDGAARWTMCEADATLVVFDDDTSLRFVELLEHERRGVEDRLEGRAAELGLPVDDVVLAMPAVELLAAVFASPSAHFVRLAIAWMLPSEIPALRKQLAEVADRSALPVALREHVRRLL
jgi:hypothetical protein